MMMPLACSITGIVASWARIRASSERRSVSRSRGGIVPGARAWSPRAVARSRAGTSSRRTSDLATSNGALHSGASERTLGHASCPAKRINTLAPVSRPAPAAGRSWAALPRRPGLPTPLPGDRWIALPGADGRERAEFRPWHRTGCAAPLGTDGRGPRLRPADGLRPHRGDRRCRRAVSSVVLRTVHYARLALRPHRQDPAVDDCAELSLSALPAYRPDGRGPQLPHRPL